MYNTVKYMRKLYGVWMLTSVHYVSVEIFFSLSSFPKREKKNQKSKIKNQKSKANG